jgi:hypothetical protein
LRRRIDGARRRAACGLPAAAAALASLALPPAAGAQGSVFERLNLDRLHLSAIGVNAGPAWISKAEDAQSYAVQADYGELADRWRVVFNISYWGSHFRDDVVERFEKRLLAQIDDPAGDDTLDIGRIRVSDIALEAELRFTPLRSTVLRPYVGGGFGAHVINAENRFIQGTFVESALDNIAAGISAVAGVETQPVRGLSFGVQGRLSLLSNARFLALRAGGSYTFATRTSQSGQQ